MLKRKQIVPRNDTTVLKQDTITEHYSMCVRNKYEALKNMTGEENAVDQQF